MKVTKLILAGALALSLAACHEEGHEFCDRDGDSETDVTCIALLAGVGKLVAFAAINASDVAER